MSDCHTLSHILSFAPISTDQIWKDFKTQRANDIELPADAPDDPAELDDQLAELSAAGVIELVDGEWCYVPQKAEEKPAPQSPPKKPKQLMLAMEE